MKTSLTAVASVILGFAYVLGLLLSQSLPQLRVEGAWQFVPFLWAGLGVFGIGIALAVIVPALWRSGPRSWVWLGAGAIAVIAAVYCQVRTPYPGPTDISHKLAQPSASGERQEQLVTLQGRLLSVPRLTRSQQAQFWMQARRLSEVEGQDGPAVQGQQATGKVYVTLPLLRSTGLQPGQVLSVTGALYRPKPAANPGGFDFKQYLERKGSFAGLRGQQIRLPDEVKQQQWGVQALRDRIIKAQLRWLGSPHGLLVSSMVMGRRVVDLPYAVRDRFISTGLAHTLAASGFHVSLILGMVLVLTRQFPKRMQFGAGLSALLLFVGLTGFHPSVARAALMGFGGLLALLSERAVKPLGSLFLVAIILLIVNPLWIWDLGFQLSFLATLGLIVTVPPLQTRLDFLPTPIAVAIAVPLAATLWTLPLQLYMFGAVAPYSILANIVTIPLVIVLSLGGAISAIAALIWPFLGSVLALPLRVPAEWLLTLVQSLNQLPGTTISIGAIHLTQLILLYGLICLVWWANPRWQRRWWLAGLLAVMLVAVPAWRTNAVLDRVTVLATPEEPVLVVQQKGKVALLNSGNETTAKFVVLPFLQKQGISRIEWAIATDIQRDAKEGWHEILETLPIDDLYDASTQGKLGAGSQLVLQSLQSHQGQYQPLAIGKTVEVGELQCKLLQRNPSVLELRLRDRIWLVLGALKPEEQTKLAITDRLPPVDVLWWTGGALQPELVSALNPKVAIASAPAIASEARDVLQKTKTKLYWTGQHGSIHMSAAGEFQTRFDINEDAASLL